MLSIRLLPSAAALLCLALLAMPREARAETFNTCTGFIDAVPATITGQGTWCVRRDLSTALTVGAAITVNTNNVTIDCNGFKLGGLAAGNASQTYGVFASQRQNVVVRNCNIRGFLTGIHLAGGAGHLAIDNRLDNNLYSGLFVYGDHSTVRGNQVHDTGGLQGTSHALGIHGYANVIDNVVSGVFAISTNTSPTGINAMGPGTLVQGNHVTGLIVTGNGSAFGIVAADRSRVSNNHIVNLAPVAGAGLAGASGAFCMGNTVAGYAVNIQSCVDGGGNLTPL